MFTCHRHILSAAIVSTLCFAGANALAGGPPFELHWSTVDAGGGTSSSASFELDCTIGQHDAGYLSSAAFELEGGFWASGFGGPVLVCIGDIVSNATFQPPPDGQVDGADLGYLLAQWGINPGSIADLVTNSTFQPPPDGIVDGADLGVLLSNWGMCD